MIDLLPPSKTDNGGKREAATTLRRGLFDGGFGDVAGVARRGVAIAGKFPSKSWTRRYRHFYLHAGSSALST